jgi:1-acyl-sn-glycerol-3-phosphate acyltransferase
MIMEREPPFERLTRFERMAVRLVRRMNAGRWQRWWFWFQREVGGGWIHWVVGPRLEIYGLEHVRATSRERPLLLVANHRTLYDLYIVMCILFRELDGWRSINFPVRGRFFYQTVRGLLLNWLAAWWAMYPPFFHAPGKRRFDQWSLEVLADLCRNGRGRLIGFHPEGTRNRDPDPYSLLPAQPGVGRLIHDARPQVVPVFVAGISNSPRELFRRWTGGPIRVWFGPAIDVSALLELPAASATYRQVAGLTLERITLLAARDREWMAAAATPQGRP